MFGNLGRLDGLGHWGTSSFQPTDHQSVRQSNPKPTGHSVSRPNFQTPHALANRSGIFPNPDVKFRRLHLFLSASASLRRIYPFPFLGNRRFFEDLLIYFFKVDKLYSLITFLKSPKLSEEKGNGNHSLTVVSQILISP